MKISQSQLREQVRKILLTECCCQKKKMLNEIERGSSLAITYREWRPGTCEIDFSKVPGFEKIFLGKNKANNIDGAVKQMSPHCEEPLPELPETMDVSNTEQNENLDDDTISNLHKVLFDVYLVEGWLICPDTGRKFPVKESIPNMILHEDEI